MANGGSDIANEALVAAADIAAIAGSVLALEWLREKDPSIRNFYIEMTNKVAERREIQDHNLAAEIANAVGKAFNFRK